MINTISEKTSELKVSAMAENLIGSEIIKLAADINEKIKNGEEVYNFTIGDFNSKLFPIPAELKKEIIEAYIQDETNYPPADGILQLRQSVSSFLKNKGNLDYSPNEILISGGSRPLIYATFVTLLDPGDVVLFPVPSWNNNHYCHLIGAKQLLIETKAENNFMPTAAELAPYVSKANMIALCSPLNPTGTIFTKKGLEEICDLILAENKRRAKNEKPLYLMYDQVYWVLTYGDAKHFDPVSLRPEMKEYTVFIDGISKAFAATGVRVGWTFGPKKVIDKMKSVLGHIGAWAPKAEQIATAKYLDQPQAVDHFLNTIKKNLNDRLQALYKGFVQLKKENFKIDCIAPQASIYLTVQFDLKGQKTASGTILNTTKDVTKYILDEAKLAMVPFYAFGSSDDSTWYRLSVGTCKLEQIDEIMVSLKTALLKLN